MSNIFTASSAFSFSRDLAEIALIDLLAAVGTGIEVKLVVGRFWPVQLAVKGRLKVSWLRHRLNEYSKTKPRFSSVTRIQTGSVVRSVTSRSVASLAAFKAVVALTMWVAVTASPSISST
ncbi:hypothetical protein [Mesorhizobium loti]|uniref:hypothetical protein n=1 Tax=Rhizobium loti TaxID=381 RepID=UPI0012BCF362|nr:hypothetical protein [Mesorhizobium loti]